MSSQNFGESPTIMCPDESDRPIDDLLAHWTGEGDNDDYPVVNLDHVCEMCDDPLIDHMEIEHEELTLREHCSGVTFQLTNAEEFSE